MRIGALSSFFVLLLTAATENHPRHVGCMLYAILRPSWVRAPAVSDLLWLSNTGTKCFERNISTTF